MPTEIEKPSEKICEKCGAKFSCGSEIGNCWCFKLQISPQNSVELKKSFDDCLCRECLAKFAG